MEETIKLILLYYWAFMGIMGYFVKEGNKIYKSKRSKNYFEKAKVLFTNNLKDDRIELYLKRGLTEEDFEKNNLATFKFMSCGDNRKRYTILGSISNLDDKEKCKIDLFLYEKDNQTNKSWNYIFYEKVGYKDFWKVLDYFVEI